MERNPANAFGFRAEYIPDNPELKSLVQQRIDHIIDEKRSELNAQINNASGLRLRRLKRKLNGLERQRNRAYNRLDRKFKKMARRNR